MSDDLAYNRRRGQLITAGRWNHWADPEPVRARIEMFRSAGASWEQIGRACGVGHMTIWALCNGKNKVKHATARRILAVSPADLGLTRIPAGGSMWRLRSLVAMGHSLARMSRALGLDVDLLSRVLNGDNATVSVTLAARIHQLWEAWWDKRPPTRGGQEQAAATKARTRAAAADWPTPINLNEDYLDAVGYRPTAHWLPATGTDIADDYPLGFPGEAA